MLAKPRQNQALFCIATGIILLLLGALALIAASGAQTTHLETMFPWQLIKLRRLLTIAGAWFAFAGTVVLVGYLLGKRREPGKGTSESSRGSRLVPMVVLGILIIAHVAAYGWLAVERHRRFNSTGFDLAIKEQVIWNTARGRFFASSPEVDNALEDHFQPVMLALVPPYALVPSPELLLWLQVLGVAAGAIPLFRLVERRLNSSKLALAVAAAYLLYPATGFVNRFDFHPEAFAIPAFIAAFDALDRDKLKVASAWLLVPLLAKENLGFSVAAFGLYSALFRGRVKFGLIWTGAGLVVSSATMFWLIPTLRQEPSDTVARYGWLGDSPSQMIWTLLSRPGYICKTLAEPNRALYLLQLLLPVGFLALLAVPELLLLPVGFLALLAVPELLLLVPGLAINLLAQHHCQAKIYCQYAVPIIPFVFIAAVVGLQKLGRLADRRWILYVLGSAVLVPAILALVVDNPFTEGQDLPPPLAELPNAEAVYRALDTVPDGLSVVTTNAYAPHLAQREGLYIIGIPAQRDPPPDPDVVFVNLYDQRFMVCEQYREYFEGLDIDRYGIVFRDWGLIVVQRDGGSNEAFRDFVLNWTDCAG
jgi:uncharacterized membrane protein